MDTIDRCDELRSTLAEPLPHPDAESLRRSAMEVVDWAVGDYLTLADQSVGHTDSPAHLDALFTEPPPATGRPFRDVLARFRDTIVPNLMRLQHPRFLAFVPTAPNFASVLGDWLTSAANAFAGIWIEGAAASQIELVVVDWVREWLGMPPTTAGLLTSGGSEANLTALVVAREQRPIDQWVRIRLYVSEHRHWSVDRAAKVIGLRPSQLVAVSADASLRLAPRELQAVVDRDRQAGYVPWAVLANAGATNTGTVDRLTEVSAICRAEGLWLHVDAAYGWAACLSNEGRSELAGIAEADSITFDPHKWFAQTIDAGGLLVRNGQLLNETFTMRPDYLQDAAPKGDEVNFSDRGLGLTRRFRALKLWFSVQVLGLDWFRAMVERSMRLAEYAQLRIESSPGFEMIGTRHLSIVCFRRVPPSLIGNESALDSLNAAIPAKMGEAGVGMISSTRVRGHVVLRMCFVNWRTTATDVDAVIEQIARNG